MHFVHYQYFDGHFGGRQFKTQFVQHSLFQTVRIEIPRLFTPSQVHAVALREAGLINDRQAEVTRQKMGETFKTRSAGVNGLI